VRGETARQAAELDARIERAYEGHPDRHFVPPSKRFVSKLDAVIALIDRYVPACCHEAER